MNRQILKYSMIILAVFCVGILIFSYSRIVQEKEILLDDLHRRAKIIAKSMAPAALRLLQNPPLADEEDLAERIAGQGRTMGILLCDFKGNMIARSIALLEIKDCESINENRVDKSEEEQILFQEEKGLVLHSFIYPLKNRSKAFLGILVVVHEASYINERVRSLVTWTTFSVAILALFLSAATYFLSRRLFQNAIDKLVGWMKSEKESLPPATESLLKPVTREVEKLTARLRSARETAQEISTSLASDVWTASRLKAHALAHFGNRSMIVVSNREPYMHIKEHGRRKVVVPAGGVVTALDPILRATSGLWIAHGAGDADREVTDKDGKILVPPEAPLYTLKRVWLSKEEEQGYYYGFSNEALSALCHLTHHRPHFEEKDWSTYQHVNSIFANAIFGELGKEKPFVLVQDYHFTLLPKFVREKRADAVVGLFWHIPWPTTEIFQICPWKREILEGMLGAHFIGFHLQSYCTHFLNTVNNLLPVRIDWDRSAIIHEKGTTFVKPFPISIEPWTDKGIPGDEKIQKKMDAFKEELDLKDKRLVISVDRLDYTKGIPERLGAIDRFLEKYPAFKEKISFVQLVSPSRIHIPRYRDLVKEIEEITDRINWKHGTDKWKPVLLLKEHHNSETVYTFLRMADVCIVSSLADGMNLVAKEFVAARNHDDGVLILSEFTGVAREFQEALQVNPYARADFAETIHVALNMPIEEQKRCMIRMKAKVTENNVYRWAADLISEMLHSEETS